MASFVDPCSWGLLDRIAKDRDLAKCKFNVCVDGYEILPPSSRKLAVDVALNLTGIKKKPEYVVYRSEGGVESGSIICGDFSEPAKYWLQHDYVMTEGTREYLTRVVAQTEAA